MVCCCVPFCSSRSGKVKGVSFHYFPRNKDHKEKWLKNISRQGDKRGSKWIPDEDSKICSKHFTEDCFSISTKVRTLLPFAIPTVFENYPHYMQKTKNLKSRKPPAKRSLTVPAPRTSKKQLDDSKDYVQCNGHENSHQRVDKCIQVSVIPNEIISVSLRQKLKNTQTKVSRLQKQVISLRKKNAQLKNEAKNCVKSKLMKHLQKIIDQSENGSLGAAFLLEQLRMFGQKKCKFEETTVKVSVLLQERSPRAYRFMRQLHLLHLPHRNSLKRMIELPTYETGATVCPKVEPMQLKNAVH